MAENWDEIVAALTDWVAGVSVRLTAVENLLRERGVTAAEMTAAVERAKAEVRAGDDPGVSGLGAFVAYLKLVSKVEQLKPADEPPSALSLRPCGFLRERNDPGSTKIIQYCVDGLPPEEEVLINLEDNRWVIVRTLAKEPAVRLPGEYLTVEGALEAYRTML